MPGNQDRIMHKTYSNSPSHGGGGGGGGSDDGQLLSQQWRITSLCVLAFLATMFLILCYYIRHLCLQERRNRRVTAAVVGDAPSIDNGKLGAEVLAALPIFVYDALLAAQQEKLECAICLTEFRDGEMGRLLPRCCHRFHMECVDMWFETHSSCPLCRLIVESETAAV